ncbi:MAG: CHAT domain-containing protein [Nigerium sp.]|nr:CHAT domain-containing protein [Nigerium sp.]
MPSNSPGVRRIGRLQGAGVRDLRQRSAERRLLDIADVSWIAPLLPRDLTDTQADPAPMRDRAPLHVIDPLQIMGQVMREADRSVLAERAPGAVFSGTRFGAEELSATLRQGVSRFVIVGHTFEGASASTTGIVLSDLVKDAPDALTAEELIADPGRWPMPPRVAVLACASASDMTDHEPFGLAAALLHNGADTVHGTLWILPTDEAYRTHGVRDRALLPMALAFENAQVADDPVAALCAWQRGRLNHWRNEPSLATSPLSWGAAMTMTAPARRSVESEDRT